MAVETYIEQAQARVRAEQAASDDLLDGYEAFIRRIRELHADRTPSSAPGFTATAGVTSPSVNASAPDRCRAVRTAFAETVRPHSVTDVEEPESLLQTIREELSDAIAVALAPATDASFTPELKRMVLTEAQSRRSEATALQSALEREEAHLEEAGAAFDEITGWIAETDETPLTVDGFDALRQRHQTLAAHRDACGDVARNRQRFLGGTTNNGLDAGVRHRSLTRYLYREFPVDYPVLATVARLEETLRECQRAVRDHAVRRA